MTSLPVEDGFVIQCIQNDSLCRCLLCNAVFMGLCQVFKKKTKKREKGRHHSCFHGVQCCLIFLSHFNLCLAYCSQTDFCKSLAFKIKHTQVSILINTFTSSESLDKSFMLSKLQYFFFNLEGGLTLSCRISRIEYKVASMGPAI